jgi:hypothetical protein
LRRWRHLGAAVVFTIIMIIAHPASGAKMGASFEVPAPDSAMATLRTPESFVQKRRFLRAGAELVSVDLIMNAFGRYLMSEGNEGFVVSFDSIEENLHAGMNWDDNTFSANNFRHPYQGGCYFNAGRANGYDFWQSTMFAFAGSWSWEYMGEKHNPSFNDWVNTALGGMILGEVTHRLSSMVLDNTTMKNRAWRELGGLLLSPVRGVNRIITGEVSTVHANPADRFPSHWDASARFGLRNLGDEHLFDGSASKLFFAVDGTYGSAFDRITAPFDQFDFGIQLNFNNKPKGIGRIEARGVLFGGEVASSDRANHVLAAYQHFDYFDNEAYTYGGQSFGASLLSRFESGDSFVTRTWVQVNGIVLGATKSDYFNISGRSYDYGPGAAVKIGATLARRGADIVTLAHESYYLHSVNGGAVDSWSSVTRAHVAVPFRRFFSLDLEYVLYLSERDYEDLPSVSSRNPELRASFAWALR